MPIKIKSPSFFIPAAALSVAALHFLSLFVLPGLPAFISGFRNNKTFFFASLSLLSLPVFIAFRSKYGFLGDSFTVATHVMNHEFRINDIGVTYIMHGFYLLLKNLFSLDAPATLVISACISGVIFVYFSFRTADVLGRTMFEKACLAIAMNANGLDSLATSWYGKAFEKYPEDPRMALNYAGVLAKAGSVDSAITVLQKTIAVFPFYFKAYPLLFEINRKKNDYMEAMHTAYLMYNAYISKPPELPVNIPQSELRWAFMELAVFLARSGTPDRAETIMNTVIMFSKNDAEAVDLLEKIRAGEAF